VLGEQFQLPGGAAALASETRFRQAGFLMADFGDLVAALVDFVGYGAQECRPLSAGQRGKTPIGVLCRLGGAIYQRWRTNGKFMRFAAGRV
jgi:hypothetical protein